MAFSSNNSASGPWFTLFAAMLWGTARGLAPVGVTPLTVGTIRLAIGGLPLLILAIARKQFFSGKYWPRLQIFISVFFVAFYQLCFFTAVAKTGVAVDTMVVIGSSPVAAGILGFLIRKETLERKWDIATFLAIAIIGCALLSMSGGQINLDLTGVFLALGAGVSYAIYTVSVKGLLDQHCPDAVMAVVFTSAALLMTPTFFFADWSWILQAQGLIVTC